MFKYNLVLVLFFLFCNLHGQKKTPDSVLIESSVEFAKQIYHTQRAEGSAILNGVFHEGYASSIEGYAYFHSSDWQQGTVVYDHILYENVVMKYDLVKDQLIVSPRDFKGLNISLYSPRVEQFSFSDFNFIWLNGSGQQSFSTGGFYQVLISGDITMLARRSKEITEITGGLTVLRKFKEKANYYLLKDGLVTLVESMSDLLSVVKDRKKEIQQFLSGKKLKHKRSPQQTILESIKFYNQSSR